MIQWEQEYDIQECNSTQLSLNVNKWLKLLMLEKCSISTTISTVSVALQLFMEDIEDTNIWQPNLNVN